MRQDERVAAVSSRMDLKFGQPLDHVGAND
jgi:hypothetical protein